MNGNKWRIKINDNGQGRYKNGNRFMVFCPFCKHEAYYNRYYTMYIEFDFCPFCGHKMKKGGNEC